MRRMAAFSSYVMVDWSAAGTPRLGRDSIWIATAERGAERRGAAVQCGQLVNLPTRGAAVAWLARELPDLAGRGRVLAGFDFPFGYPAGTAARLGLNGVPWRSLWSELARAIADGPDNANNRFDLAEDWNRRMGAEPFPFWGNVREEPRQHLVRRGCRPHGKGDLALRRLADARVPGAHTVWQLAGNGSVGSQALLGIPRVWALRHAPGLAGFAAIWPFETGLRDAPEKRVILAEAYPSLQHPLRLARLPKDAGQVSAMVEFFAAADDSGTLATLFGGDPALTADEQSAVIGEEAWILGVTGPSRRVRGRAVSPSGRRR
jgi:precorrin-8X/cobalt-precorrin-8 methylmutase